MGAGGLQQLGGPIQRQNLTQVRAAVASLPEGTQVPLEDAARILALIEQQEPWAFEQAAVRWIARYAAERALRVSDIAQACRLISQGTDRTQVRTWEIMGLLRRDDKLG
jgi:hypothetical protein